MKVKMVLNMKQGEKNKKLGGKKNRKLSTYKDPQNQLDHEDVLIKDAKNVIYHAHNESQKDKDMSKPQNLSNASSAEESVSMESMVTLNNQRQQTQFLTAIKLLKCEAYKEAVEGLKVIITGVQEQPNYGDYVIYARTKNKRTTLSALNMFAALAYEGLANPKKAIEFCNNAINEDPGWPIPFSKRSEYFSCLEQFFLDIDVVGKEEINRSKITADIIVDQNYIKEDENEEGKTFNNL